MRRHAVAAAAAVGIASFALYRATLLPGLDLGDTASFQASIGSSNITPRDAYPLYFALGNVVLWITGSEPAHALNIASAIEGAGACAVLVLLAIEVSGSVPAALAAGLLFASSYTFWSQAILAEVYALHILLVALTLWLVLRWARRPTLPRLALFLAVYALGFGNHLSMILLAPALILFLFISAPGGWRALCTPQVLALGATCAIGGSLQYGWNMHALCLQPQPPQGAWDALQRFWFDVTKADWRETMVVNVPQALLGNHASMYAFDLEQQFGWVGPLLALAGLAQVIRTSWRSAALIFTVYAVNVLFAFTYNVGDAHVFYLPSHLMIALLVAPGLVLAGQSIRRPRLAAALLVAYAATRAWRDYPALDRSRDTRPTDLLASLTTGLDDRRAILVTDLNWQLENGLTYFAKAIRPSVAATRMPAVVLYLPALVASNAAIKRDVTLTTAARDTLVAAYGPLYRTEPDPRASAPSLAIETNLPEGTRYVLCILKPTRDLRMDWNAVGQALSHLTGNRTIRVPDGDYAAIAGLQGQEPAFVLGSNTPFRRSITLDGVTVDIRMESWLAADTIRRMGFGQVIAAHRHTLIVERGVSFVAFDGSGWPIRTAYASSLFAPQARYLIPRTGS